MATIDPWGGYNQGMQNIQSALTGLSTMDYQSKLRDLAILEKQEKLDEIKRQKETREGLAGIYAKSKELKPEQYQAENPEYATSQQAYKKSLEDYASQQEAYKAIEGLRSGMKANPMDSQLGELELSGAEQDYQKRFGGLGAPVEPTAPTAPQMLTQTRMVPKYGREELQQQAADFLASRGEWTALKGLEGAVDITSKVGERQQKMVTNMFNTVKTMKQAGFDDDSIRASLKQQADSINKLQGSNVIDPSTIDKININKSGDLIMKIS